MKQSKILVFVLTSFIAINFIIAFTPRNGIPIKIQRNDTLKKISQNETNNIITPFKIEIEKKSKHREFIFKNPNLKSVVTNKVSTDLDSSKIDFAAANLSNPLEERNIFCQRNPNYCKNCRFTNWGFEKPTIPKRMKEINIDKSHLLHIFSISNKYKHVLDTLEGINITYGIEVYPHKTFDNMRDANYLHFIIDNFNNLPKWLIFIHGHETSPHQFRNITDLLMESKDKIERFDWGLCPFGVYSSLDYSEWVSKNITGCKHWPNPLMGNHHWGCTFLEFAHYAFPIETLGCFAHPCCAQFIVNRERLRSMPLAYWQYLAVHGQRCLSKKESHDRLVAETCAPNVLEWVWHLSFGEQSDLRNVRSANIDFCVS